MTVIEKDLGWKRIKAEMLKAHNLEVAVGVQEGSTNAEGASIAEYGAYNEYGTKDIPSRPFMATSFDDSRSKIDQDFQRASDLLIAGQATARKALLEIGQKHALRIQAIIQNTNFLPKLEDSTIKAKKGSNKTLVDTGALINSIRPVVRKRGL